MKILFLFMCVSLAVFTIAQDKESGSYCFFEHGGATRNISTSDSFQLRPGCLLVCNNPPKADEKGCETKEKPQAENNDGH